MIMARFSLLLLSLALLMSTPANAARIYNIVDYPDLQNGHSLSGTITTTDEAPDDGLLQEEEILDWEWEISGDNSFHASFDESNHLSTVSRSHVSISKSEIGIRLDDFAILRFTEFPMPENPTERGLIWFSGTDIMDPNEVLFSETIAYYSDEDNRRSPIAIWNNLLPSSSSDYWTVAVVIPEPSAVILLLANMVTLTLMLRSCSSSRYRNFTC